MSTEYIINTKLNHRVKLFFRLNYPLSNHAESRQKKPNNKKLFFLAKNVQTSAQQGSFMILILVYASVKLNNHSTSITIGIFFELTTT